MMWQPTEGLTCCMVLSRPQHFPWKVGEREKNSLQGDSDVSVLTTMLQYSIQNIHVSFEVFIVVIVKIIVFWDAMPCRLANR